MTCENFTGARFVSICSSLRAIGSLCATRSSNSPDVDLSTANFRRKSGVGYGLIGDRDRSPGGNRLEETLGHELRHPNATVRCGIAWQITRVHSDTIDDAHEERHRRAFEMRARGLFIVHGNVRHHDISGVVNEVAIFG